MLGRSASHPEDLIDVYDTTPVSGVFQAVLSALVVGLLTPTHIDRAATSFRRKWEKVLEDPLINKKRSNNACEDSNNDFGKVVGQTQ